MNIDKLKIILNITNNSPNRLKESYFIKNHKELYDEIIEYTSEINDIIFKFKIWHWVNDIPNYILCECGNRVSTHMNWQDGYKKFCSSKCSSNNKEIREKTAKTIIDKYGVDHYSKTEEYKKKYKKTSIEKYGVDNYSKTPEYIKKSINTYEKKYGVSNYTKTKEYLTKSKNTCFLKYGVDNYSKTPEFKEKFKNTCIKKYGTNHIFQNDKYRNDNFNITKNPFYIKYLDGFNIFKCDCNEDHEFKITTDDYFGRIKANNKLCTICHPISNSSSIKETMVFNFINDNYDNTIIANYRDKYEIDIYLPDKKIGFEFNGIYWHSEKFKHKNYHIDKTNYFKEKGIRIIHIWEDDWVNKESIIKSQILNILNLTKNKIFARKCYIKELSIEVCSKFLKENHILGKVNSVVKLGLYYENNLIAMMSFDNFEGRKRMPINEWNINRFCNLLNTNIPGSASKLLSYFIKNYNPTRIISYADKDWSTGNLYYKLGFNEIGGNGPDYKYIINDKRTHKSNYKKSKLNTNLTEAAEMYENGILKIYDCGKIKFEKKYKIQNV